MVVMMMMKTGTTSMIMAMTMLSVLRGFLHPEALLEQHVASDFDLCDQQGEFDLLQLARAAARLREVPSARRV